MQVRRKPQLDTAILRDFLAKQWPQSVTKLENLVEGEDSQAFYFDSEEKRYVLRINPSDYGFRKDAYAYERFASRSIPIPKVFHIGQLDADTPIVLVSSLRG